MYEFSFMWRPSFILILELFIYSSSSWSQPCSFWRTQHPPKHLICERLELMLEESGERRRGQRSFWSLFYWPDQMRNNGGQCHKHWPRYFLFTRNNDSIWAGASDPRAASRLTLLASSFGCFKTTCSHKVSKGFWQVGEKDGASQRICV